MAQLSFRQRSETFGFDTDDPWALHALRLICSVPRTYDPLVAAWDRHHPGTRRAIERLVASDFIAQQDPIVVCTRTGEIVDSATRAVARFRATRKGIALVAVSESDWDQFEAAFPQTSVENLIGVVRLLEAYHLEEPHSRWGMSMAHAVDLSGLPDRTGRWWTRTLLSRGYIQELPDKVADSREIVPAHYRPTRLLCRQLADVIDGFELSSGMKDEFRTNRSKFIDDIDPTRVGITGATDYDHDIECQRILAAMLSSKRAVTDGRIAMEPRWFLPINSKRRPATFTAGGEHTLYYQPDAELRERDGTQLWRTVVEYERSQSRRDGWNHIERFLGWVHTKTLPVEPAVLRFVVDSPGRARSYIALIEAFTAWAIDHPDRLPQNRVVLAVADAGTVKRSADPLGAGVWSRVELPTTGAVGERAPTVHTKNRSPYDEYFTSRSR